MSSVLGGGNGSIVIKVINDDVIDWWTYDYIIDVEMEVRVFWTCIRPGPYS